MEQRRLLHEEDEEEEPIDDVQIQKGNANSSSSDESLTEEVVPGWISSRPSLVKIYRNRQSIPGYGIWVLVRQSSPYALYVLFIMLLVYLLNQLDRYTLSITARFVGFDVGFGDLHCLPNFTALLSPEYDIPRSVVFGSMIDNCTNKTL